MTIPTFVQLRDQIIGYVEARLNQSVPRFARGFVTVLASAVAGVLGLSYRFTSWCLDQTQPSTCNEYFLGVWSDRYGVVRSPAVASVLTMAATGSPDGSTIPAGTLWSTPSGVIYQQTAIVTIAAGVASPSVTCLTVGASGNLANGSPLSLVSPVSGINPSATVASTTTTGVDRQSVADWRAEVVNRIRYKPQGGAIPDYVIWALEVPGIVKAFVKRPSPGDVNVYPLDATTGAFRLVDAPKLAEVLAYLNDPIRKPLAANVYAISPTERTCSVTITSATINGNTLSAAQKTSVETAITAALYAAYPRQYIDEPTPTDTISTGIVWTALVAIGATAAGVTINISGIGGGPYVLPIGEIIAPGVYTWA